jgi:hypothetical protein
VLKLFLKSILIVIGVAFGLFCLLLASYGAIRLHGWSQTGRFAPPHYPGLEKFDIITFAAEPLRAFLEIGGSAFIIALSLYGLVIVIFIFWRGLAWLNNLPYVLPLAFVLVFSAMIASVFTGRTDWILPASMLLGCVAFVIDWISLRRKGLPITARLSDMYPVSQQTAPAHPQRSAWVGLATAALLMLLAMMKIIAAFKS